MVGVATVDITPPVGSLMAGFAVRVAPSAGVHDPLLATAVAVSHGDSASVIVSADLISLDMGDAAEIGRRIAEDLGIPAGSVAVTVSHTHGGPKVKALGFGAQRDEKYVESGFAGIVNAGRRAWKARRSAWMRSGVAYLDSVAHNRRGTEVIDPTVFAIQWTDDAGAPIVTIFSHACHPVTLGPDNLSITADWPGAARRHVREAVGGEVMFVQGCCGQINTGHLATDSFSAEPAPKRTFAEADAIGARVGDGVSRALRAADPVPVVDVVATSRRVWLPTRPAPDASTLREWARAWKLEAAAKSGPRRALLEVWSEWALYWRDRPSPGGLEVPVSVHWWGGFGIVMLPGEPFVEFALDLRNALRRPDLLVMGYTGGVPGYIPLREADYAAGGYEIEMAYRSSRLFSGPYTPDAGRILYEAALDLARERVAGRPVGLRRVP
nr:neutral/alkaline non-lysosomal ceramidase N-terminal domain-containing protein [Phytoactinopolyspora alkaliphila]